MLKQFATLRLTVAYLFAYFGILLGVLYFEAELFQLGFDGKQPQTVCYGRIYKERFARYFELFALRHGIQCAHIVEPIRNFDQNDAYIVVHRDNEFAEVLRLCALQLTVSKQIAAYFGEPLHDLRHLITKQSAYILHGILGILHYIVQQRAYNTGGAEPHLLANDYGNRQRVQYIRLTATPAHAFMCLFGEVKCLFDAFHLTAMVTRQIGIDQLVVFSFYQLFLFFLLRHRIHTHLFHTVRKYNHIMPKAVCFPSIPPCFGSYPQALTMQMEFSYLCIREKSIEFPRKVYRVFEKSL